MKYKETKVKISKEQFLSGKFHNVTQSDNGELFIRVGLCAKYYDNGKMQWGIEYNNFGEIIKLYPSCYEDGSFISY